MRSPAHVVEHYTTCAASLPIHHSGVSASSSTLHIACSTLIPNTGPLSGYLSEIRNASERGAALTSQLLAFSRKQVFEPRTVDTNQLIVGLHRILGRLIEENIELKIEESTQVVPAYVDLGQIEQVIINLVVNARDAMPDGGRINIGLRTTDRLPGLIGPLHGPTASEYVVFSVEDTGMGMTEDVISRIFEPFFTTKAVGAGTGLGLSTCYGIVTQADGHIAVESKVGVGSKFQVYLPKAKEIKANLEAPTNNRLMLLGVERVMVVEGEPALKMLISGILSKRGYQVTDASNGIEALSLTREHPNDTIDLLITDIVMPKMGGKQLATELKLNHPEMKVLYMSGYPDVHSDILEADPVNSSFIRKPFTFEALEQKVRQSIEM